MSLLPAVTPDEANLLGDKCKSLVDPKRILILYALNERPHNVGELAARLDLPQSTISRHLQTLLACGVVASERQGVTVAYTLVDHRLIHVLDTMRQLLRDHLRREADLAALVAAGS